MCQESAEYRVGGFLSGNHAVALFVVPLEVCPYSLELRSRGRLLFAGACLLLADVRDLVL